MMRNVAKTARAVQAKLGVLIQMEMPTNTYADIKMSGSNGNAFIL